MHCFHCKKPLRARFEITHYDSENRVKVHSQLCSLTCVIQWAIRYGVVVANRGLQKLLRGIPKK